jgi:type I restriction enzyme R subunit
LDPEDKARQEIDQSLTKAGWSVQDPDKVHLISSRGIAVRHFSLKKGFGEADYLLYLDGKAAGVVEAKKIGHTLTGVEVQSGKYSKGLPANLPAYTRPLPFLYESTGEETQFTNGLDPDPHSRPVFSFHKPETLITWLEDAGLGNVPSDMAAEVAPEYGKRGKTFHDRICLNMQELRKEGLWSAQITAIQNLEHSLKENRLRALIQMATGSGKTFTAINIAYRLIKFADAKRILFLVDRANLGKQTLKEFQQFVSPYNNFKFHEEFIVQPLTSNTLDQAARVCISTIQRLYSMLKGRPLTEEDDEQSLEGLEKVFKEPVPIEYNPAIPIETFDVIIIDECHRSIYNLWRQVVEYFDAYLIGLTATPDKQTFGFFRQNLVMEYNHEQAVADGVNVNYDVYSIKTEITQGGGTVEAGYYVDKRDRETRAVRWEQLDEPLTYGSNQLDRDVVAVDQIRKVIQTYRDKLFTEIFPGRTHVPKTLIFAKDDSHAEDIVKILREEFGKGNDFAQKITYRTTGKTSDELIAEFRNSYLPRIAVTVELIGTGTDIKPVEVVMFMRDVKSRNAFEQKKGRGVRVINSNDLQAVTPDAATKDHYIIIDAVGVCEGDKTDSRPMEKKPSVSFEKLLQAVSLGNTEPEILTSIASRLARMERTISQEDQSEIVRISGDLSIKDLSRSLVDAVNPDRHLEKAQIDNDTKEPSEQQIQQAAEKLIQEAVKPLYSPDLRNCLIEIKKKAEQTIDHVSQDQVIEAGFDATALERARGIVGSFKKFIKDNKDEITAIQILYSKPYKQRLTFEAVKELADAIEKPPYLWNESQLWNAYAALEQSKVRGAGKKRILTDLVSLVRFAMHQDNELIPFPERVNANFNTWLAQTIRHSRERGNPEPFTPEQIKWLEMIRDHIAANLSIGTDDFDFAPFMQQGGIGRAHQVFGKDYQRVIEELNETLAA